MITLSIPLFILFLLGGAFIAIVALSLAKAAGNADRDAENWTLQSKLDETEAVNKQFKEALSDEAWAYYYEMQLNNTLQAKDQETQKEYNRQRRELAKANETIVNQGMEIGELRDYIKAANEHWAEVNTELQHLRSLVVTGNDMIADHKPILSPKALEAIKGIPKALDQMNNVLVNSAKEVFTEAAK